MRFICATVCMTLIATERGSDARGIDTVTINVSTICICIYMYVYIPGISPSSMLSLEWDSLLSV